jgi:hypothetical protein
MSAKTGVNNLVLSESSNSVSSLFASANNYLKEKTETISWEKILIACLVGFVIYLLYTVRNQSRLIKAQDDFVYKFLLNNSQLKKQKRRKSYYDESN